MKRNITLIICLLCFGQVLMAQELLEAFKDNNNLYGLKDKNGNVVVEPKYTEISYFSNGIMKIEMKIESSYKKGLIDGRTGKEIIPPKYNFINSPALGMQMGIMEISLGEIEKYGVINNTGREIIPAIYEDIKLTKGGFAIVEAKVGMMWATHKGIFDAEGREIVPVIYNLIRPMENNKGFRVRLNGMEGFFNNLGKEIIPANKYDLIDEMDIDGFMKVRKGKKFGLVNEQGKEIAKCIYDYLKVYYENGKFVGYFKDGYTYTRIGKKFGFVDTSGNEVPCKYQGLDMSSAKYGFVTVIYKGKEGVVDNKGREIVPFKFESIDLNSSYALKKQDKSGKTILDYANLISPETGKALIDACERIQGSIQEEKKRKEDEERKEVEEGKKVPTSWILSMNLCNSTSISTSIGFEVNYEGTIMTIKRNNGKTLLRITSAKNMLLGSYRYLVYEFEPNKEGYTDAGFQFKDASPRIKKGATIFYLKPYMGGAIIKSTSYGTEKFCNN